MYRSYIISALSILGLAASRSQAATGSNFTIVNGQILTPGLAIVDSPQPNTPLGGSNLEIALEVSGNGRLPEEDYTQYPVPEGVPSGVFRPPSTGFEDIKVYLYSMEKGVNFTIVNGTSKGWAKALQGGKKCNDTASVRSMCTPLLQTEIGSTVKHIRWDWPACFSSEDGYEDIRGTYNISIHQSFRANHTNYHTIFDLPIQVANAIPEKTGSGGNRLTCAELNNKLVPQTSDVLGFQPWVGDGAWLENTLNQGVDIGNGEGTSMDGGNNGTDATGNPNVAAPVMKGNALWTVGMLGLVSVTIIQFA